MGLRKMKSKSKNILRRILLVIGIIVAAALIWLACNYKYLTTLTLSYDYFGNNEEGEYDQIINSLGFSLAEDAEEVILYLKGQVTKGEVTISLYRTSDDINDSSAFYLDDGLSADEDSVLLYTVTFKEGDTFDVEESLGSLKRGYFVYDVEQTEDLEIQIWENIDTYNYGWVHEKYRFLNRLRRWGLLKDREASD